MDYTVYVVHIYIYICFLGVQGKLPVLARPYHTLPPVLEFSLLSVSVTFILPSQRGFGPEQESENCVKMFVALCLLLSALTTPVRGQAFALGGIGFNDSSTTLGNIYNYWRKLANGTFDLTRSDVMGVTAPKLLTFSGDRASALIEPTRSVLCIIDMLVFFLRCRFDFRCLRCNLGKVMIVRASSRCLPEEIWLIQV